MMQTQVYDERRVPLIGLPSARLADPGIKPGPTQSKILVITQDKFEELPQSQQQGILRDRCILVLDIGADPDPGFSTDTMSLYRNPDIECEVHGRSRHLISDSNFTSPRLRRRR